MLYKEDWDNSKKVLDAWWNRGLDRPLIQIFSPKIRNAPPIDSWAFLRHHPNPDKALDALFQQFSDTIFSWEAYPNVWVNLGPGSLSAYLGGELRFDDRINTSWFRGDFSLDDLKQAQFDPNNEWWRYTCQAYESAAKRCKNKAVVAFTDLLDAVTCTGQLRGNFPTNLLRDMFTDGTKVRQAFDRVHELFFRYYEESCKFINVKENGYSTWAGLWSKKGYFTIQCDFIVYLSPKLFSEFVLPLIIQECDYFNRTMWHLDGPLELTFLDDLLDIEELDCIQWIPGEGNPDSGEDFWVPLYNKIQEHEKLLQIYVPPEKVMHILGKINSNGVAVNTSCQTRTIRDKLIKQIKEKYCQIAL